MRVKLIVGAVIVSSLVACGGGGGGGSTALTSPTTSPVINAGSSTELAGSVKVGGFRSLSIAATTTTAVKTASVIDQVKTFLADILIKPAYAQSTTCQTDAYKLVGVGNDGSLTPLPITTSGTDSCNVGFREMYDLGSYILLTGEGIYKDDLTCNLVFLQKENGNLYCVGETLPSRYQIQTNTSSSATTGPSMAAGGASVIAEKIQNTLDSSGNTQFTLVNAQSTTFDSNNQISGIKTKLMRFDLTDTQEGPKVSVILEGYQSGWSAYATTSEFEWFNLENYRLAKNGDVLAVYYRSIWTNGSSFGSSNQYRRNLKYFYDFSVDGSTFESGSLRDTDALTLINTALNSLVNNNTGYAAAGGTSATATQMGWLNISCMFDAPSVDGGVLITTPSNSWVSGYDSVANTWYSQWSSSSSIFRVTRPTASSNGKPVFAFVKPSLLCADTNTWSGNTPQKIGDTWYTMQTSNSYSWGYDPITTSYRSFYGNKTKVIGNSLANSIGNVNDDVVYTVPSSSNDLQGGGYYWAGSMSNTRIRASKDYMYLLNQGQTYTMSGSSGMEISRFKISDQTNGEVIINMQSILDASRNISISAFTTTAKDNVADLAGRDLGSDDLDKIYGTISEDGTYNQTTISNKKFATVAVVKL